MITQSADLARAEELWSAARQCLLDLQGVLLAIIAERAWEPLGYESFAAAWSDRMSDITVAPELRPHVVYQLLGDGMGTDDVAKAVKGVGPKVAAILKRQRDNGVPPDLASTSNVKANGHLLCATVFLKVPRDTLARWKACAAAQDLTIEELALAAVEERVMMIAKSSAA